VSVGNEPGFTAPQTAPVQAPPPPGPKPIDYSADPWLQRFMLGYNADEDKDKTSALAEQKRLLLGFGSKELAAKLLGADDPFVNTISSDPKSSFSLLANMQRAYDQTVSQTEGVLNKNNLFFGGHRGKALGELATGHLGDVNQETVNMEGQFNAIRDALLGRQTERRTKKEEAEFAAWERANAEAAKNPSVAPPGAPAPAAAPQPVASAPSTPAVAAPLPVNLGPMDPWAVALGLEDPTKKKTGSGSRQFMPM
jgi:hypothetical protein